MKFGVGLLSRDLVVIGALYCCLLAYSYACNHMLLTFELLDDDSNLRRFESTEKTEKDK